MPRSDVTRARAAERLVSAARIALGSGRGVSAELVADICEQSGVATSAFRGFFPDDDALLDAVGQRLVDECATRLRSAVDGFDPGGAGDPTAGDPLDAAGLLLARAWPLDRGGLLIRAERRLRALTDARSGDAAAAVEREFVDRLVPILSDLMTAVGRRFTWAPKLAVRVIIDTYERSFETWLLTGNDEEDFADSPYARRTLPALLRETSAPV
ncbi:MAG: hypothetical protein J0G30_03055 [Actinomycetales bacterium]|nr:hypothetical protein [Actinomycetales bacterium]